MTMRTHFAALTFAAAAVSGCGHDQFAAKAGSDRFGLYYDDRGTDVALAYGRPHSDEVALMLLCQKGSGQVQVSDVVRRGPAPTLVLTSGAGRTVLGARVQSAESDAPAVLEAATALSAAGLAGLRRSGRMEVSYGAVRYWLKATSAEQQGVEQFFQACRTA